MKNSSITLLFLSFIFFMSCKKNDNNPTDDQKVSLDHKIVFKASTNPHTAINSANYTDGSGKTETLTNSVASSTWESKEYIISALVKTINFSAAAPGIPGDNRFYLNVEIWVDGVKKAEEKTITVTNMGLLKATTTYSF